MDLATARALAPAERTAAFLRAIASADALLAFLGVSTVEQFRTSQLAIGDFVRALIEEATRNRQVFQPAFFRLYAEYAAQLSAERLPEMLPVQLQAVLLLLSFLGSLTQQQTERTIIGAADYFLAEDKEAYFGLLAEHCVFPFIDAGEFAKALRLEMSANLLGALLERPGKDVLQRAAMLVWLRRQGGRDCQRELEILALQYGEAELGAALGKYGEQ